MFRHFLTLCINHIIFCANNCQQTTCKYYQSRYLQKRRISIRYLFLQFLNTLKCNKTCIMLRCRRKHFKSKFFKELRNNIQYKYFFNPSIVFLRVASKKYIIYQSSKFFFSCVSLVESVSRETVEIKLPPSHQGARETMHYIPLNN